MSDNSLIEWTDSTWNPVTGCTKISSGCKHCYAERFAERFRGVSGHPYEQGFDLKLWPERLEMPLRWKKPRQIFVNSMSDLFHKKIPTEFIQRVFEVMHRAEWHIFQVLTKRPARARRLNKKLTWPPNIWLGTTIENINVAERIHDLLATGAQVKFLSLEPLLDSLNELNINGIDWIVVGGESGPNARPMKEEWVKEIHQKCVFEKIPFFFKQWGGVEKKKAGREYKGQTWDEMPKYTMSNSYNQLTKLPTPN